MDQIIRAERVWLFLDYDGTLADFELTPDVIHPDPVLCTLLNDLVHCSGLRLVSISGRRLIDLRALLPVAGMWLAGIYGAEWITPQGNLIVRLNKSLVRPVLDVIKAEWENLIAGAGPFHLEDKGLSLALHAKYVEDQWAAEKLAVAQQVADELISPSLFQILGGHKFLEVAPIMANKGQAVSYLLDANPWVGAQLIYLGDDDKDEAAFETVQSLGGTGILISKELRTTQASHFLESPQQVRQWLRRIVAGRSKLNEG